MNFDRSALKDKRLVEAGKKSRELVRKKEKFRVKREFSQRLFYWRNVRRKWSSDGEKAAL